VADAIRVHPHDGSTDGLRRIVADARPDVVFHLASLFVGNHGPDDVEPLIESNLLFGTQLAEAMSLSAVQLLVNAGTAWQHYDQQEYSPANLYAATKQAYEAILHYYVDAASFRVVTVTIFDTYGPHDTRPKLLPLLDAASRRGTPLAMSPGSQSLNLVHVDDVVDGFVVAADRLLGGNVTGHERYALAGASAVTLRDLVALFVRATGRAVNVDWGAKPYRQREVMVPWSGGQRLPGWEPKIELEEGLRRCFGPSSSDND
jgi:nucleoside-diphosphate-sugar epimerase